MHSVILLWMTDFLGNAYPHLAEKLRKTSFASLPTPVSSHEIDTSAGNRVISIKHDDQTSALYGGNKIRKLEYIFRRATDRGARRVATFGTVGSNHALATAVFAKHLGLECTCFLAHQKRTPNIPKTLNMHLKLGTEMVRYGGSVDQLKLFRRYLQHRHTWVIPLGGSCWFGAVGFVNAGLELAAQVNAGEISLPDRIYIANGTMGSVAGLALGLALAELPTKLHAVRVADNRYTHPGALEQLMRKTVVLLNRLDASIPLDLMQRTRLQWRDDFFAGGYAQVDDATQNAVAFAHDQLGLALETTYTGKAMAAMLHDLSTDDQASGRYLFWNTHNSRPLPVASATPTSPQDMPAEFMRYFD